MSWICVIYNISRSWNNSLVGCILRHTWSIYQNTVGESVSHGVCRSGWSWNHISFPQAVRPFGRAIPNKSILFSGNLAHVPSKIDPLKWDRKTCSVLLKKWKKIVSKGKIVFTLVLKLSKFAWSTIWKYLLTSSMLHCQVSLPESPFPLFKSF